MSYTDKARVQRAAADSTLAAMLDDTVPPDIDNIDENLNGIITRVDAIINSFLEKVLGSPVVPGDFDATSLELLAGYATDLVLYYSATRREYLENPYLDVFQAAMGWFKGFARGDYVLIYGSLSRPARISVTTESIGRTFTLENLEEF